MLPDRPWARLGYRTEHQTSRPVQALLALSMLVSAWLGHAMIKSELVHRISDQKPQLYARDVEKVVNTILDEIAAALARGDRVELRGFGVFAIKLRQARRGRNPRSGSA